jgi:hypothetical protein
MAHPGGSAARRPVTVGMPQATLALALALAAAAAASPPFPRRAVYPQLEPDICVVLISYESDQVKLDGLDRVYSDAIDFFDSQQRPTASNSPASALPQLLRYEVVWVDNGSSDVERAKFQTKRPELERTVLLSRNVGLYGAMNAAWFDKSGCSAPYVLSLEDDWVPRRRGGWRPTHIRDSIELLRHDPTVGGVRLKDDWTDTRIPVSPWRSFVADPM